MLVLHGFWSNSGGMRLWAEELRSAGEEPESGAALRAATPVRGAR